MVRGRKRDLTVAPTRQLTQQRDYRARKARYISELEQRCSRAEEENARLRQELELARAAIPFASPHEVVQVSSELLRNLVNASASIARFQEITAPRPPAAPDDTSFHGRQQPISSCSQPLAGPGGLRPQSPPCQAPSQPITLSPLHAQEPRRTPPNQILSPIHGQPVDQNPTPASASSQSLAPSPAPSYCSECCGGYLDCTDLLEEKEEEEAGEEGEGDQDYHFTHTSKLRSSQGDVWNDAEH
ncbi:uncharacterized protein EDB91DRAFT_1243892 [Suillus paluster]|uniref:uncharacterized protein n=1 Tax=Suillus paluster TaxID=48578 RepID=UPI001B879CBF|nr:uncharacterized protein EDB91DRAFT_1243892 [Suillus paluster]KAG1751647.1 hypothetical protein EDB91DRAFT_1243892 [Suillus paluster]